MAFGIILVALIILLVVAVLIVVIGYLIAIAQKARQPKKSPAGETPPVALAPDPDAKKTMQEPNAEQPPPQSR